MCIPILQPAEAAYFARLIVDEADFEDMPASDRSLIEMACLAAEQFAASYTGLPSARTADDDGENNEVIKYALKCIAAEMIDNRNISWDYNNTNPMVRAVLNLYTGIHLPEVE